MSNKVDFYQSAESELAIPAGSVSVFAEDGLCNWLEVKEIVRSGWGEFGWAKLVYNPAQTDGDEMLSAAEVESRIGHGKEISIVRIYNGLWQDVTVEGLPVFTGRIEEIETKVGPEGESVEAIARDFSAVMERVTVFGRRVRDIDGTLVFLAGADTVFNEDGRANASVEKLEYNGKKCRVFSAEESTEKFWSFAEVIDYLLCEYLPAGQLQRPSIEQLEAVTESRKVRDLDVTGLSLLEAVQRCCEEAGLRFKFEVVPVENGAAEAIVFYKPGFGRVLELNIQMPGEQLSISKTNIDWLKSRTNSWPLTHKYTGHGDFKVYEATFELVQAWDKSLEDTDYDKFSPSTNPDFIKVKDVYRRWTLNEAGDYTGAPYNCGDAFDFSKVFEGGQFVHRRRRFLPTLSCDKSGKALGYFLEVSFDDGQHFWQYLQAFDILLDECGIWLSSDRLDVDTWVAALKGVLRFRITASVVSDERLSCELADGPVNSAAEVSEHIITVPRRFKFRRVSALSIFSGGADEGIGSADEVDDGAALYEFVRKYAQGSDSRFGTTKVQTPFLCPGYGVGDIITVGPDSRDLPWVNTDSRSAASIERVRMDFEKQYTELEIARQRRVYL